MVRKTTLRDLLAEEGFVMPEMLVSVGKGNTLEEQCVNSD
jgi:hypothetical protein